MLRKISNWAGSDGAVALVLNVALLFIIVFALSTALHWQPLTP